MGIGIRYATQRIEVAQEGTVPGIITKMYLAIKTEEAFKTLGGNCGLKDVWGAAVGF